MFTTAAGAESAFGRFLRGGAVAGGRIEAVDLFTVTQIPHRDGSIVGTGGQTLGGGVNGEGVNPVRAPFKAASRFEVGSGGLRKLLGTAR